MALLFHGTSETRLGISRHQSISHKESKLVCAYNNVGCSDQKISAGNGNQLEERKIPSQLISELSYQRGMKTVISVLSHCSLPGSGGVGLLVDPPSVPVCQCASVLYMFNQTWSCKSHNISSSPGRLQPTLLVQPGFVGWQGSFRVILSHVQKFGESFNST